MNNDLISREALKQMLVPIMADGTIQVTDEAYKQIVNLIDNPICMRGGMETTTKEAGKYLIAPTATSTKPSAEYLKQKEAYELAIKALEFIEENFPKTFIDYLNGEEI